MCISRNKSIFFGLAYSFSPRTLIIIAFWKNILLLKLSNSSTPPTPSPTSVAFLFSGVVFFLSDIDSLSFPLIGHYRVFYSISENLIRNRLVYFSVYQVSILYVPLSALDSMQIWDSWHDRLFTWILICSYKEKNMIQGKWRQEINKSLYCSLKVIKIQKYAIHMQWASVSSCMEKITIFTDFLITFSNNGCKIAQSFRTSSRLLLRT